MLPNLLAAGAVDGPLVQRIARRLARFHVSAATGTGVDEYGSPATVRANWVENFAQTARFLGQILSPSIYQAIIVWVDRFFADRGRLLERRVAAGRIREGHGDLHAGICVEGRRLHLFDCLEFNPRFRCADVAAEVAFLAMDLDHHGRADIASAFVDAYARESGDAELPTLLSFYKCYRAYVRGKVLSLRLTEVGLTPARTAAVADEARAYFDLAWASTGVFSSPRSSS